VGSKARVLNVIDPIVAHIGEAYADRTVGLIGTKQTVNSNVYKKKVDDLDAGVELRSLATPLLAPMIEEGFFNNTISENIISSYLGSPVLNDIEALVLACTHYPLIQDQIQSFYQGRVAVLDASDVVASHVKAYLDTNALAARAAAVAPAHQFYVSDFTRSFEESTRIFFGQEVHLEHYPLWE
jgi:glutamate racemase